MKETNWIDVSVPVSPGLVHWPKDKEFELIEAASIKKGDSYNQTIISMSSHTGTHMDAPRHFTKYGPDVSEAPLDTLTGKVKVIEVFNNSMIEKKHLVNLEINKNDKLLFKTDNSKVNWTKKHFMTNYVSLTDDAAEYLIEREIVLTGMDYLSIGSEEVHIKLMEKEIWIIEGLDLSKVSAGEYEMVCLPIKIVGAEGAPARVILRKL